MMIVQTNDGAFFRVEPAEGIDHAWLGVADIFPGVAPAASVLISESDDFELPSPRANLVIRAT
jgi:hypothetical protein